jgi:hypothetical protein
VANVGDAGVREVLAVLHDWPGRLVVVRVTEDPEDPEAVRSSLLDTCVTGAGSARAIVARWRHGTGEGSLEILGLEPGSMVTAPRPPGATTPKRLVAAAVAAAGAGSRHCAAWRLPGVGRRLELQGDVGGVVLDDYGHPTAMAAALRPCRAIPGRRPRPSATSPPRTAAMLGGSLTSDRRPGPIAIHAGRDPTPSRRRGCDAVADAGRLGSGHGRGASDSSPRLASGDVVLVMGSGRSYVIAERLVAFLRHRWVTSRFGEPSSRRCGGLGTGAGDAAR